ncbi:hypothetical protein [Azospirillum argentinense]
MKRFKSPRQVERCLSNHDPIATLFHLRRDHRPASDHRAARAETFATWIEVAGNLWPRDRAAPWCLHHHSVPARQTDINLAVPKATG